MSKRRSVSERHVTEKACLICSQIINSCGGKNQSSEVLSQLAKLLHVSTSIYRNLSESLPDSLVCSSCQGTVSSALILHQTLENLEGQLRSLTDIIKKDFLRSYKLDDGPAVVAGTGNIVKRIRKTFVQFMVPCEVQLTAVEAHPDLVISGDSDDRINLPLPYQGEKEVAKANWLVEDYGSNFEFGYLDVDEIKSEGGPDTLEEESIENTWEAEDSTLCRGSSPETNQLFSNNEDVVFTNPSVPTILKSPIKEPPSPAVFEVDYEKKSKFSCQVCSAAFSSFQRLYAHRNRVHRSQQKQKEQRQTHSINRLFKCSLCSRRFFWKALLERHMKTHAEDNKRVKCALCPDLFDTPPQLQSHILEIHNGEKKKYPCEFCGFVFTRKYSLRTHLKLHNGEKDFSCNKCSARFPLLADLRSHGCGKTKFSCGSCHKSFTRNYALKLHMQIHNGIDKLRCEPCDRNFESSGEFGKHVKWHAAGCPAEKEAPLKIQYTCSICNQGYEFKHAFEYHMKKHSANPDELISRYVRATLDDHQNVTSFDCDVCKEVFSKTSLLNSEGKLQILCQHGNCSCNSTFMDMMKFMQHHSKICTLAYRRSVPEKQMCDECGKEFSNEQNLLKHIHRCHPKNEAFSCPDCGKVFGQKHMLETHIALHHSTETPFQCHICGKAFKTKIIVNAHMRRVHGYECNYACEKCGKKFKTRNYLDNHLITHRDDQDKCQLCGKVFKSRAHVWHHIYSTHERRRPNRSLKKKGVTTGDTKNERSRKQGVGKSSPSKHRKKLPEETHIAICHSTEASFPCHICGKAFKTKIVASAHLRRVHGYGCNYTCEKCGKNFKIRNHLDNHIITHHNDQEKCQLCGKVFKSRAHVLHHIYSTHERRRPNRPLKKKGVINDKTKKKRSRKQGIGKSSPLKEMKELPEEECLQEQIITIEFEDFQAESLIE